MVTKRHKNQIVKTKISSNLRRGENTENSKTPENTMTSNTAESIVNRERGENASDKNDIGRSDKRPKSTAGKRNHRNNTDRTFQNVNRRSPNLAKTTTLNNFIWI